MFVKNYRKIIKTTLLITTFIAPLQNSFGAEPQNKSAPTSQIVTKELPLQYVDKENQTNLAAYFSPPIHYIAPELIQTALNTYSEIILLERNIAENTEFSNSFKKEWIKKAFSNLKEMTDIIQATKFEQNIPAIKGWDPITKSFDEKVPFFRLSQRLINQNPPLSTTPEGIALILMDTLKLKLYKKKMFLKTFQQIGQSFFSLDGKIYKRNSLIWSLFETRRHNKDIRNDFTDHLIDRLFKNKKRDDFITRYKIKLLYTQTETQKKYSEIKSKMESIWDTYIRGYEIIKNLKNNNKEKEAQFFIDNMSSKTLPSALEGLSTQDIENYFCYLLSRNKLLKEILKHYKASFIPTTLIPRVYIQPKTSTIRTNDDLLAIGKSLIENLSKDTLDKPTYHEKITWITNALSMLKLYENDIDKILFDTYLTNPVYTYSSWDDNSQLFTINPNFKIGISFHNKRKPTYEDLLRIEESYLDSNVIPQLLKQSHQKQWEYMAWIQRERGPITKKRSKPLSTKTKTALSPAELSWEITHYAQKSQDMMNQIDLLIQGFTDDTLDYNVSLKINPNLPYPERILLQKAPSQEYISCSKLIIDIYQHWAKFAAESGPLNFNSPEDMHKKNPTVFERLFLEFMKPVLAKYTHQDLQLAAASIKHQFAMFNQVNKTICSKIEEKCQSPNPKTKLAAQQKLSHKYEQNKKIIAFPRQEKLLPTMEDVQNSEKSFNEIMTSTPKNHKKPHKDKTIPLKGNKYLTKEGEDKRDVKSVKEIKRKNDKIQKNGIQLIPLNGRYGVVGESHPYEPTKKILTTPQHPEMPTPIQTIQPLVEVEKLRDAALPVVEPLESLEQPTQQESIPETQPLQKTAPVVEKAEPEVQLLPIVEPIVEKVEPAIPMETEKKQILTLAIETPEKNHPTTKSVWKPKTKSTVETETPFISKETTETSTLPSSESKAPIAIQQINYLLAHNPSWNGYLYTPDTKVIIPNENVKEIIIQTGTINLVGPNNIAVHVYHHYPEKK